MVSCESIIANFSGATDTTAGLLSACIQAEAAKSAATTSGFMTLGAGLFAVVAGLLAFAASYKAAKIQVAVTKAIYESKLSSYRFRIMYLAVRLERNLRYDRSLISGSRPDLGGVKALEIKDPGRTIVPEEFLPVKWEEHSMLGQNCVEKIVNLHEQATYYNGEKSKFYFGENVEKVNQQAIDEIYNLSAACEEAHQAAYDFVAALQNEPEQSAIAVALGIISGSLFSSILRSVVLFR